MATNRFTNNDTTPQNPHTEDSILAKLDTEMSDSERKAFIKTLLQNVQTVKLVEVVELKWKMKLLEKQMEIEKVKEKIRMENIFLDSYRKNPVIDDKKPERSTAVKIPQMEAHIKQDETLLGKLAGEYVASEDRAKVTLNITEEALKEIMKELNMDIPENQSENRMKQ